MVERVVCACSLTVTIQLGAVLVFISIFSISVFSDLPIVCCLGRYVYYCMKYINNLLSFGIKPIMVFDGCRLPSKQEVEKSRRE